MMYPAKYAEISLKFYACSTLSAAQLSTSVCIPANGIESIVLPLHDGQISPNLPCKDDAHQKQ